MRILLVVTLLAGLSAPVGGHHSFASYYFEDQSVMIEGEVAGFNYTAPHAWVYLMAPDETGTVRRFSAEWANPNRLANLVGVDKATHTLINNAWAAWKRGLNGRTPTQVEVMRQALAIDAQFGHLFKFPK